MRRSAAAGLARGRRVNAWPTLPSRGPLATVTQQAGDYDDVMSQRLLGTAADVLPAFGSAFGGKHLAIVGGAVLGLLVPKPPPGIASHVGTADLDPHLSLHLLDGETAEYYDAIVCNRRHRSK